jgi:hypothetical protein
LEKFHMKKPELVWQSFWAEDIFFIFNQSYFYLQEQTAPIVVANLNDSQGRKKIFDLRI